MNNIAALLLLFSGLSALTYQVVWLRLLGLSIGMTSAAVGAVLAAVFLGMALGSWLTGRLPARWQGQLRTFSVVEAVVGISALLLLPVLLNLDHLVAMMPELGGELWFRFSIATLLLAIPAAGLGAAYPLVASIFRGNASELRGHLGRLYAMHTMGAVIGALLTAFVLIPWWGLDGALYTAVSINLFIAALAFILSKKQINQLANETTPLPEDSKHSRMGLIVLLVTGVSATAVEIGWVKFLTIYTESTFVGFALLLAIFLSGIAFGSILILPILKRIKSPATWLAFGLVTLSVAMFSTRAGLNYVPDIDNFIKGLNFTQNVELLAKYMATLLIMLPTSMLLGSLFPLSLHCYCGKNLQLSRRVGQGYAVNTVAGLIGAAAAGLWILPSYGTDQLLLTVASLVAIAALLLWIQLQHNRQRLILALSVIGIVAVGHTLPELNFPRLITHMDQSIHNKNKGLQFLFLKEGHAGVISLVTYGNGIIKLKNNSLNEAHLPMRYARGEVFLGLLPHILHSSAERAFVVGYGAGTTTELLATTPLQFIKVVELEPAVIEAMASHFNSEMAALNDPRFQIEFNDARNTLLREKQQYDIIISQPSHPWRAGASMVFTKEYFKIVHSRLNKGGISSQWLNLFQMDATTMRSIIRAYFEVFPHGAIFIDKNGPELFLLGSDNPLTLDHARVTKLLKQVELKPFFTATKINKPQDLLEHYLMTRQEALTLAGSTLPNSDLNLLSEVRLAALRGYPDGDEDPRAILDPYVNR